MTSFGKNHHCMLLSNFWDIPEIIRKYNILFCDLGILFPVCLSFTKDTKTNEAWTEWLSLMTTDSYFNDCSFIFVRIRGMCRFKTNLLQHVACPSTYYVCFSQKLRYHHQINMDASFLRWRAWFCQIQGNSVITLLIYSMHIKESNLIRIPQWNRHIFYRFISFFV